MHILKSVFADCTRELQSRLNWQSHDLSRLATASSSSVYDSLYRKEEGRIQVLISGGSILCMCICIPIKRQRKREPPMSRPCSCFGKMSGTSVNNEAGCTCQNC